MEFPVCQLSIFEAFKVEQNLLSIAMVILNYSDILMMYDRYA